MKKILLGLGTVATVVAPIAATVSCGDDKKDLSLEETRTSCIQQINSETDLSQDQKDEFVQRINEAKTSDEILEIAKEASQVALEAYKKVQIAYVNSLDNESNGLTDDDKTKAISEINAAESKDKVDEIVDGLPLMALERYKKAEALSIKKSEKLDEAGKTLWAGKLNDASDLDAAKEVIDQMNKAIFEQAKRDAVNRLNSYDSLSTKVKEECGIEVDNATNDEELAAAINHMDTLAFDEVKAKAKEEANKYSGWTPAEKSALIAKIDAANNVDELNLAVEAAKLKHEKDITKSRIASLNLTSSDKTTFTTNVENAGTISDVKEILENALLQEAKNEASSDIDGYNLSDSEKVSFKAMIAQATDSDGVQSALDAVTLQDAKNNAVDDFDNYTLSASEKASFVNMVNNANDQTGVQTAVNAALAQSQTNLALEQAKDAEILKIEGYTLSDADREAFKNDVRNASNLNEIANIDKLALARQVKEIALNDAKTVAHKDIDDLDGLSQPEKDGFIDDINKVTEKSKIPPIVSSAKLQGAKNTANKNIDGYRILQSEKDAFKNRVAQATTPAEVLSIVDEALAQQTKEDDLKAAKNKAIAAINGYKISADEKTSYIANINKAADASDIQPILDSALLQQSKEKNLAIINALTNINKAALNGYITRVNSAKTPESIELIAQEAVMVDGYSGSNNFEVTLGDAKNTVLHDVALNIKHSDSLSDNEKLEAITELLKTSSMKPTNEYDPKYGDSPWLMVHGKVIPGIHHSLHQLTDAEKLIYVNNVFTRMFINKNDTTPDLKPLTWWGRQFSDDEANICPALNKGGWYTKPGGNISECLYPNEDNLITEAEYKLLDTAKMASQGIAIAVLPDQFKIHFFNNMFHPTFTGYHHAMTSGSLSKVITDESKFLDGSDHSAGAFQNDLVVNGNHFKVSHTSDSLSVAEGVEIYDKLIKSIYSLDLIKLEAIKKVPSYHLTNSEKSKLMIDIKAATTAQKITDLVNAVRSK